MGCFTFTIKVCIWVMQMLVKTHLINVRLTQMESFHQLDNQLNSDISAPREIVLYDMSLKEGKEGFIKH